MTAFSDVNLIINTLKLSGIENLDINLFGFEKGGLSYQGPILHENRICRG